MTHRYIHTINDWDPAQLVERSPIFTLCGYRWQLVFQKANLSPAGLADLHVECRSATPTSDVLISAATLNDDLDVLHKVGMNVRLDGTIRKLVFKDFCKCRTNVRLMVSITMKIAIARVTSTSMNAEIGTLLDDESTTDLTLRCRRFNRVGDNMDIRVHRLILIARSPFFRAMFQTNFREVSTGVYECGFSAETMQAIVTYLYTATWTASETTNALELLDAAHYYELQYDVEEHLATTLTIDNVVVLLNHASKLDAQQLKSSAMTFIHQHLDRMSPDVLRTINVALLVDLLTH